MLSIIVPYRDREAQLKLFIAYMNMFYSGLPIVVVEQLDEKPFNRARLLNIGYLETKRYFPTPYYVFHDVDMIPVNCPYLGRSGVTQLAYSGIQREGYLGGVTMFDAVTFEKSEGYHNEYFHRAEDNEMRFNLQRLKIRVEEIKYRFEQMPHPRTGPEFIPELWQKAQLPRTINMLETCEYSLVSKEVHETHTHIKVAL